jgi:hypothetical protein
MSAPVTEDKPAVVETPSGKGAADENFPVGSFLLPKHLRPHVATYYAFARAIDDIADNPDAAPQDKIARLNAMDDALLGRNTSPGPELDKATAASHFDAGDQCRSGPCQRPDLGVPAGCGEEPVQQLG